MLGFPPQCTRHFEHQTSKKQEARSKKQEARSKKQEARSKKQEKETSWLSKMSNIYRIYPALWRDAIYQQAATVYAIDRPSPVIPTTCTPRPREDPAYSWEGGNFQRLLPPPGTTTPPQGNAVTWSTLPIWLSYVQTLGYTLNVDFSRLKPYSEIYISGS